ncbi:MAG: amidohydrolase family protein [Planctomycetota bacterium]
MPKTMSPTTKSPRAAACRPPSLSRPAALTFAALLPAALLQANLTAQANRAAQSTPARATPTKTDTRDVLVTASRIVVAPKTVLTDSALLIRDGKIAYVGNDIPAEAKANARSVAFDGKTISSGLVLAATTLGRDADLAEAAIAFTPDLRASDAFNPWADQLSVLPMLGVTSFGLMPSSRNVAGGVGSLAKPGAKQGRLVQDELFVGFSLIANARNQERDPTSLMGARQMLDTAFNAARSGVQTNPELAVLREVMSGARRAFVHADTYAELNAALDLSENYQFAPVLLGARDAHKVLAKLATRGAQVVLGTISPTASQKQRELPKKLAEAGVPFAFAGRADQMRLTAAIAVRNGLDRATAIAAITRIPAEMLGVQDRVGSLRQGCSADFVVFEGDLLDLSARHVATWIDGAPAASGHSANGHQAHSNSSAGSMR